MGTSRKLWGGRFQLPTDRMVERYTSSVQFDRRLYPYDIEGSIAHCRMLARAGIIGDEEADRIVEALSEIRQAIDRNEFEFDPSLEDIHMNIEARLTDMLGSLGQKLHTARSRNDQIALDMRMFVREAIVESCARIRKLRKTLVRRARDHMDTIFPGYTHLQRAQPVLLSHHLLAYVEMFGRDEDRMREGLRRVNVLPLGSAALAGTSFPVDREYLARALGFDAISQNSMDAVSDRDFVAEFLFAAALTMMHVSRLAEELVLWSSMEFGFVEMSDAHTTGSSIMPQKKNPDVAELARGKTGRVYGNLFSLLTVMKGLPLSYNRDLQEDKEPLFDTVDTLHATLAVLTEVMEKITFHGEKMRQACGGGFLTATDLADYLVRKGLPFRRAHHVVGELVQYAARQGKELSELALEELRKHSELIEEDVYPLLDPGRSVEIRRVTGGTAPERVREQIERLEEELWEEGS